MEFRAVQWNGAADGILDLIDQTLLPAEYTIVSIQDVDTLCDAIRRLVVRGAPAIGIAAAYGMVLASQTVGRIEDKDAVMDQAHESLSRSRPTAVNLFWALDRMKKLWSNPFDSLDTLREQLLHEANTILEEDIAMCQSMGAHGAKLVPSEAGVLTHCNAGGLATGAYGTAIFIQGVIIINISELRD